MATMGGIKRMPIKATRALLNAALDGSLNDAEFRKDPNFGFLVPVAVPGVDTALLDPREAWADKAAYDRTAEALVQQFIDNFAQFADHVDEGVRQAAPQAAVAACSRPVPPGGLSPGRNRPITADFSPRLIERAHHIPALGEGPAACPRTARA